MTAVRDLGGILVRLRWHDGTAVSWGCIGWFAICELTLHEAVVRLLPKALINRLQLSLEYHWDLRLD